MVQRRGRAGLLLESVQTIDVGRERAGQNLDRNVAAEPRVARAVHFTHPARAECGQDLVRSEASAWLQQQGMASNYRGTLA